MTLPTFFAEFPVFSVLFTPFSVPFPAFDKPEKVENEAFAGFHVSEKAGDVTRKPENET